jgi:hypothetical protein
MPSIPAVDTRLSWIGDVSIANRMCPSVLVSRACPLPPTSSPPSCAQGPCYQLTSHLPATATLCLAEVASVSNDGLNPSGAGTFDVWGGPLANGDYTFAVVRARTPPHVL